MQNLKNQIISQLNMGLSPAVIGMQDNGLYYLFDMLLQGKQISNSYDPNYTFVHVTLSYIKEIPIESIENQINLGLEKDTYPGNTIAETYDNEVITVCIMDDLSFLDNPVEAINCADILVRRYRGALKFVFVIEDPLFLIQFQKDINPTSIFWESINYQEIGKTWTVEGFAEVIGAELNKKVDAILLQKIAIESNNYYGLVKRKYRDNILGQETAKRFIESVFTNLSTESQLALKKLATENELNENEEKLLQAYENVGLVKLGKINIPDLESLLLITIVKRKITLDEENRLKGIDLGLLNKIEREIIKTLLDSGGVLQKSKIGDIIWKNQVNERYSEWAIDQRIARLRKKIIDLGFNIDVQTVYGKGYQIGFIN